MSTFDPAPNSSFEFSSFASYGSPSGLQGVSFWPRVAARVIDTLVHFVVSFLSGILFVIMMAIAAGGRLDPVMMHKFGQSGLIGFAFSLVGTVTYHTLSEGVGGCSLGKLILGMTVLQEDGSPCRLGSALIRSGGYLIDSLFFGLIGYFAMQKTPLEQRHGDEWAHTVVCRRRDFDREKLRRADRIVLGLFLGVFADAAVIIAGLLIKLMA